MPQITYNNYQVYYTTVYYIQYFNTLLSFLYLYIFSSCFQNCWLFFNYFVFLYSIFYIRHIIHINHRHLTTPQQRNNFWSIYFRNYNIHVFASYNGTLYVQQCMSLSLMRCVVAYVFSSLGYQRIAKVRCVGSCLSFTDANIFSIEIKLNKGPKASICTLGIVLNTLSMRPQTEEPSIVQ